MLDISLRPLHLLFEWNCWQNNTRTFTETNANTVLLTMRSHNDLITVLNKLASVASGQIQGFRALPRQLQHRSKRITCLATDGSRSEQITRVDIASGHRVVGELLQRGPVQKFVIRAAHRRFHFIRCYKKRKHLFPWCFGNCHSDFHNITYV